MSKHLKYTDFRTASYRNLYVCNHLLDNFDKCNNSNKQQILHKIYYLSGYIIEFCYKYALFSQLVKYKTDNIYSIKDSGFQKKWKEHNYRKLESLCQENKIIFSKDIPFLGKKITDKNLNDLINNWDVQIRYSLNLTTSTVNLTQIEMKNLVILIEDILKKTTSKFH
ncbi:hypothetical protein [Myroides guanonis]|uniref:HEPN domain-containing protein n=1 Tax=Myroides guanonis TaxID=1150112 RepID=A0A1I3LNG5_9FLAO|nr:hypothetical protein [Myroides guanonis]SFI86035.1 hypothetical protein SAMN04487893_101400 [Myroides guanonis]